MPLFRIRLLAFAVVALTCHAASAAVVTLPNSADSVEGSTSSSTAAGVLGTGNFTNQYLFASSLLSTIPVGYQIEGLRVRADGANATGTYPASNLIWTNYDITLAEAAVSLTTFGTAAGATVANNMLNPQQVRAGSLTINVGSFSDTGAGPNPFGPLIVFDTPYIYQGVDLVLLISHSTATGTGFSVDASNAGFGYGTSGSLYAQRTSSSYNATSVSTTSAAPVIQLEFNVAPASVPEPDMLALFALGGIPLAMIRRRQRKLT